MQRSLLSWWMAIATRGNVWFLKDEAFATHVLKYDPTRAEGQRFWLQEAATLALQLPQSIDFQELAKVANTAPAHREGI